MPRHAARPSRIGSWLTIHAANRGPVIRRGEQHACTQFNINKVAFRAELTYSRLWNSSSI